MIRINRINFFEIVLRGINDNLNNKVMCDNDCEGFCLGRIEVYI